jgi:beta-lactamase regulating signal transducer with metallopeptidase domain
MIAALINHLWQSTLFCGGAWLITLALRDNGASLRHWIWMLASLKFLVPFSLLFLVGSYIGLPVARSADIQPLVFGDALQSASVLVSPTSALRATETGAWSIALMVLLAIWIGGALVVGTRWLLGWLAADSLVRAARPAPGALPDARITDADIEPAVARVFHPVVLLPAALLGRLSQREIDAILAHEHEHIARHDNLKDNVHRLVETLFWFHPAVWWIGRQMIEERELACDEAVLANGHDGVAIVEGTSLVVFDLDAPTPTEVGRLAFVDPGFLGAIEFEAHLDGGAFDRPGWLVVTISECPSSSTMCIRSPREIGCKYPVTPRTRNTFRRFEPITEPTASAAWPRLAATKEPISSGSAQPTEITVSPSIRSDMPIAVAMPRPPRTNRSEPATSRMSPRAVMSAAVAREARGRARPPIIAPLSSGRRSDSNSESVSSRAETVSVTMVNSTAHPIRIAPSSRDSIPFQRTRGTAIAEPSRTGTSRRMMRPSTVGGAISAVSPRISEMFAAHEPTTVPIAIGW